MDPEATLEQYLAQLEENPTRLGPVERLERDGGTDWEEFIEKLEGRAEDAETEEAAGRCLMEAGRLSAVRLEDESRGAELLDRAFERSEGSELEPEVRLFRIALGEGQEQLLQFFTNALERAESNRERARLYVRMGYILEQLFGDLGEADNAYSYALELEADNLAAMWSRERVARRNGEWKQLGELLAREIELVDSTARQTEISVELGEVYLEELQNEDAARECFAFAYELDPERRRAKEGLVELGELDESELEADRVAEGDSGDGAGAEEPEESAEEGGASAASDGAEPEADSGGESEMETGQSAEAGGDGAGAQEAEAQPPEEVPAEGEEVGEIDEDSFVEVVDEGEAVEEGPPEAPPDAERVESDGIEEERLERGEQDEDVEAERPGSEEEGEAGEESSDEEAEADDRREEQQGDVSAEESAAVSGDWRERAEDYRRRAEEAATEEAIELLAQTARLEWLSEGGEGGDPELWADASEFGDVEAFYERMHFYFFGEEYWSDVHELLEQREASASLLGRIALYHSGDFERAESYAEADGYEESASAGWIAPDRIPDELPEADSTLLQAVEDARAAADNWRRFQRSLDQRYSELSDEEQARKTYGYLADLARATGQEGKEVDALRRLDRQVDDARVKERLMVCYRRAEKWPMYVDLVKEEAGRIDEDRLEDRIEWLLEAVRVYRDEMDHDMMVVNTYKEILELDPDNLEAVDSLIELYEEMNRSSELINALQQKAELVDEDDQKIELYTEIADLFIDKFRNQAEAIDAYESVLEIDPHQPEALEFLTEMYEKRRDWEKLVDVRRRSVEAIEEEHEKIGGLKEVAELATDKLRKPDVATDLWLEVRELAPEDREALDALEQLYEKARDHERLAETVEQKVELVEEPSKAMALYQKLGMLYSDRLDDPESAIEAWQRALEIEPENRKARKALERLYVDHRKFDELEEFYAERGEHRELVRMLDTLVGTVDEEEVKIEILLRGANIWRTELEEIDRAKRNLERALEIDERHEGIARELEPIYRREENWKGLRGVLEVILDHQEDSAERREYQLELARLHEEELDDPGRAFDWYARAAAEIPGDEAVAEELEGVAERSERWSDLVEVYEGMLEETDDPDIVERLRLKIGRILFGELNRADRALEQFQAVLDEDGENVEALAGMEKVYRSAERWDDLMGVYQRRLDLTDHSEDKVEILRGIAEIAELQKGDLDEAIERLDEALELDPNDEQTLEELRRLYRQTEAHEELVDVIERQVAILEERAEQRAESPGGAAAEYVAPGSVVPPVGAGEDEGEPSGSGVEEVGASSAEGDGAGSEGRDAEVASEEIAGGEPVEREALYREDEVERLVELRYELGAVSAEHLGRDGEAIDALGRVLEWRPSHEEARVAMEGYLDDESWRGEVAGVLEPVYEVHGAWESLVDSLEIQAEEADDESEKIDRFEASAEVLIEEVGSADRSFEAYGECLRLEPAHERCRQQLVRIADGAELWQRLADLLDSISEEIDGELRREYLFEIGEIYADRLGEPTKAEAYYREILEEWPDERAALERLETVYARTERWRDLLEVFEEELEYADGDAARQLRFRMAVLYDRFLEQPHQAIDVLRSVLDEEPEQLRAIRALTRLYEENELWDDLAEMAERELELVDEEQEFEVKKRLADIHYRRLDDQERAVDLYEEVLEEHPDDREAIEAMEELMSLDPAPSGRISRILEPLYLERQKWGALIDALEVQVEESDDEEERVELLHRVADLRENRQEDLRGAFETLSRALGENPEDEQTLEELYRLAEAVEDWRGLVGVFEERAAGEADPDLRRELLRRAAAVYLDRLEAPREAAPLLHDVLEIFPDDLETIDQLEQLYRELEDWDELVEVLRHKSDQVEEVEERKELLYQAGDIYDDILEEPEEAVDVFREVLEVDEVDARAVDRLEQLFTRLEWWTDLLEIYEKKLELVEEDEGRKDLLYAMAPIYEEELDQPYEAVETYRDILEVDAEELDALERLSDLYEQTEQWHELLEVLEEQKELVELPEERRSLQFEIGELWETQLGDVLQAVETYREILDEAPDHGRTREALAEMVERGEAEVEAAEVLSPIYEEAGEWERLVRIQELLIEGSHDPEEKLELYRQVGDIYEEQLGDPAAAFENYLEALEVAPSRGELLDTVERLAAELGGWDVVIDRYDEVLDETTDFEVELELNRRVGRILDEEIGNPAEAIARYEAALEAEPEDPEVTAALDSLYQQQKRWEELAEILQTRIYTAEDAGQRLELRSRLGVLYQNALEQPAKAVDTFESILEEHPENDFAIESLEEMFMMGEESDRIVGMLEPWYVDRGRHEKLVDLYLQRLERLEDPLDRFELLEQVGELYLTELDEKEKALQVYGAALAEQPGAEEVVRRIEQLAEETGAWDQAAGFMYEALESSEVAEEETVELWGDLARILDEELGQIEDAEVAYREVLDRQPGDEDALEALDRIYEAREQWGELAAILQRRLEHTYDEEIIVDVQFRLAQLYQHELEDHEAAVETYRDLLDIRPMHESALAELEQMHRSREEWEELFDVLERTSEATDVPDEKVDCFAQMATIAEQMLGRPVDAIDLWNRVLEQDPDHRDALQELGRLYYAEERWDELVGILERQLELVEEPAEQLELYKSLGMVWGEKLENEGPALDAWQEALELDPDDLEALRAVRELYTRRGDYEQLAPILERLIDHDSTDDSDALAIWEELAEIRGEMLLDPEGAIEAWRRVLSIEPTHREALDNLEELYIQEAEWEEAAQILELQAERVDEDDERIELLGRIADIWERQLGAPERAAAFYEEILELDPSRLEASRSLEQIYRDQSDPEALQGLVELYLDRAEVLDDRPFERMEALQSAARVFEEGLENPVNALVVLVSAFNTETYDDEQLNAEIARLARETGEWEETVEKYQGVIRELGDSPEAARLHEQVGRWYAEELDQPDDAIYHFRRALDIEPERDEILEALETLYRDLESWPELAQVLNERIERTADPDRKVDLWRSLGELYELQMGEYDRAVEAYWNILEIDESDLLAIESLERIYESEGRWEDLISILERKAESTYDPDDIVEIRTRIATIWEEQLGDRQRAIEAYEELLSVETDHLGALEALERLYHETEQWEELLEVYEEQLSLTHEPEEQVEIHGRRASVWEEQLGDPERAVEAYDQILMIDPEHEGAMQNLERLYRELEQWFELVEILQNHIETVEQDRRRVQLLNDLARVQRAHVDEPYAAIEAFEESREIEPEQPDVLFSLAELYERTENWGAAVEAYESLLDVIEHEEDRVDVRYTIGELLEEELRNHVDAEHHYKRALELDPDHGPTWEALEGLYERTENWEGLIDLYTSAAEDTRDLTQKARYYARAGSVYDKELDERRRALDFYEKALEEDPRELEAAEPLIELYLEEDEWERAVPLIEMVIEEYQEAAEVDREALEDRYVQLAQVYEDLQQDEEAIEQYWKAFDLDRNDVEVLLGLGRLLYEQEEYRDAEDILERLEQEFETALETDELIELYYRAGKTKQQFGKLDESIDYFERAIELDGYHQPTLEALDDVHEEAGNWSEVVEYKRRLLEVVEDDDKFRFALLTDIGEICVDHLGDPNQAIEAYQDAMEIEPESVAVLRKLLEIYRSADQWHEAVDILDRLIEQQQEPERKAKFSYTAAVIYRDKIRDRETAVEYFDQTLDNDIEHLEAFEAIDRIYTELKEWKELERAYRRMLRRINEQEELGMEEIKFKLWYGLGETYRSRLGHPKSAIQAFETAAGLRPDDEEIRLILAELYEETGQNLEGVIDQHQALIQEDPFRIESYKALFRVYLQTNQYDRAWCVAAALTFLEKASEEERRIYEQYRSSNLRKAETNLDQEAFDKLYHPEQEVLVNYINSILNQGLREVYADDIKKDWGLHPKKDKLDMEQGTLFANVYNYVAETIKIAPVPEVYLKKDQALGVRNANVHPPGVVAGADVVQNTDAKELAFRIGKLLGGMRSEYYLGSIGWPTEVLKTFFMAAMHVTNRNLGLENQLGDQGMMIAREIENMPSQMQMQLRKHVSQYLKKGENPNLSRWLRYVDHTTNRLGLLICGDLETAASFVKSDRTAISKASVKDQIREMILFVISDEFTELRERLGLAIG